MFTLSLSYQGPPATDFHLTLSDSSNHSSLGQNIPFSNCKGLSAQQILGILYQIPLELIMVSGAEFSYSIGPNRAIKIQIKCTKKSQIQLSPLGIFLNFFPPAKKTEYEQLLATYTTDPFLMGLSRKKMELLLQHAQRVPEPSAEELHALKTGDFSHPLFKRKEYPLLVFKGYLTKSLDSDELSHILLYQASRLESTDEEVAVHTLEESKKLLKESLRFSLSDSQFSSFIEESKKLPEYQRQFFVVTREKRGINSLFEGFLRADCTTPLFLLIDKRCHFLQLVLHPACFACLLKICFGKSALQPKSILGYEQIEKLPSFKPGTLNIPWKMVEEPRTVNKDIYTGLSFYHYSLYSLLIASSTFVEAAFVKTWLLFFLVKNQET